MHDFKPLLEKAPDVVLSINISATHMLADGFLDDVDSALKETNFPPENLELELTESVFVDSLEKAKSIMREIKDRGIHIALDDFGTGYSSLSYLKELPIDLLKIDKAFVDSITDGPKEESFVAAIISLSQLMQFAVISEGVEEEYQLDILRNLGCDYMIMGQHFLQSEQNGPYTGTPTDDESRIRDYVDAVIEGMKTGSYLYLAHPDLMNYQGMDSVYDWEMTRLCKEMKELDIPLEINMLGMGEGQKHYPTERFWKIPGEVGNKVILGLDAHCKRQVQDVESYNKCMHIVDKYNLNLIDRIEI